MSILSFTLWWIFISSVNAQLSLSRVSTPSVCVGDQVNFTCSDSTRDNTRSLAFVRDTVISECSVNLSLPCSQTYPSGKFCGCVEDNGSIKTHKFTLTVREADVGSWTCGIVVDRFNTTLSNVVTLSLQGCTPSTGVPGTPKSNPEASNVAKGLVIVLAIISFACIVASIVVRCVSNKTCSKVVKILVTFILAAVVLIFVIAVGAYNLGTYQTEIALDAALHGASIAFVVIGCIAVVCGIVIGSLAAASPSN